MSTQHLNIEHLCNTARRQVADEFKDINLIFIVHPAGKRQEMLERSRERILSEPNGRAAYDILSRHRNNNDTVFVGFLKTEPKGPLRFFKKSCYTCLFFINSDQDKDTDAARVRVYNLLWYGLDIAKKVTWKRRRKTDEDPAKNLSQVDGVILHRQDKLSQARHNMMADIFTGVLLELQAHEGEIIKLAHQRSLESLSAISGNTPELRPYPVALEATEIVFQDLKSASKDKPLSQALSIASEVADTLGDDSIKQWWGYAERAQHMAWLEASSKDIISTAIYTSEDTYVKAAAYIVSEILQLEPEMITNLTSYNPFTESEVNGHLHFKACEKDAKNLADQCVLQEKNNTYMQAVKDQCEALVKGRPLGWAPVACADAMLQLQREAEDPDLSGNTIKHAYLNSARGIKWESVEKLLKLVVSVKRKKGYVESEDLPALMQNIDSLAPHASRIEQLLKGIPEKDEQANSLEQRSKTDPTAALSEDDYLEMDNDLKKDPVTFD